MKATAETCTPSGRPPDRVRWATEVDIIPSADPWRHFVFFWRPEEADGYLSNWYLHPFECDGFTYTCVEQMFMHKKALLFDDRSTAQLILDAETPREHKRLGSLVQPYVEEVWNQHRFDVLHQGLRAKFSQSPELQSWLWGTGSAVLAEASPSDTLYGIGLRCDHADAERPERWPGANRLGFALMDVRDNYLPGWMAERQTRGDGHEDAPVANTGLCDDTEPNGGAGLCPPTPTGGDRLDDAGGRLGSDSCEQMDCETGLEAHADKGGTAPVANTDLDDEAATGGCAGLFPPTPMGDSRPETAGGQSGSGSCEQRGCGTGLEAHAEKAGRAPVANTDVGTGTAAGTGTGLTPPTLKYGGKLEGLPQYAHTSLSPAKQHELHNRMYADAECSRQAAAAQARCGGDESEGFPTGTQLALQQARHKGAATQERQRVSQRSSPQLMETGAPMDVVEGSHTPQADPLLAGQVPRPNTPTPRAQAPRSPPRDLAAEIAGVSAGLTEAEAGVPSAARTAAMHDSPRPHLQADAASLGEKADSEGDGHEGGYKGAAAARHLPEPTPFTCCDPSPLHWTMIDAFAGVSAFGEAMTEVGIYPTGYCEIDPMCLQLLLAKTPMAWMAEDFYDYEWMSWQCCRPRVLTAGPSCVWATPAGKRGGSNDVRSNQIVDVAEMAAHFQPDLVFIENVCQVLMYADVMQRMQAAFKAAGYQLQATVEMQHNEMGGATRRRRVFFVFERTDLAKQLPPIQIDVPQVEATMLVDYLRPAADVPDECIVRGRYRFGARRESDPPVLGYITHGGPDSQLQQGSLVLINGSQARWRVMSVVGDTIELLKSDRKTPRRRWLPSRFIRKILYEETPFYSIYEYGKSLRGFGEWPVRTGLLLYDDRLEPHGIRPLLDDECWRLQELCDRLLAVAQGLPSPISEAECYKISGNSIPRSLLRPLAKLAAQRLALIDTMMHTVVRRPAGATHQEQDCPEGRLSPEGRGSLEASGGIELRPCTVNLSLAELATEPRTSDIVVSHIVLVDIHHDTPRVLVTPVGEIPHIVHVRRPQEWSCDNAVRALHEGEAPQALKDVTFMIAADDTRSNNPTGIQRVVVGAAPPALCEAIARAPVTAESGRWLEVKQVPSGHMRQVNAAMARVTTHRELGARHHEYAHTEHMLHSGAREATRLAPKRYGDDSSTRTWEDVQQKSTATLQQLALSLQQIPEGSPMAEKMREWGGAINSLPPHTVPMALREDIKAYDDEALAMLPFTHRCIPPVTKATPRPRAQLPVPGFHPQSIRDLLEDVVLDKLIPEWIQGQLEDIANYKKYGAAAERKHNKVLAIGQDMFREPARGRVWDLRGDTPCLLDYEADIDTHLHTATICEDLRDFPDQELLSFLRDGVQFKAESVELQMCFCPHLMSLSHGVESVELELKKLAAKGWYGLFQDIPFVPMCCQAQGSVPRPKDPSRWRRVFDGGAPRKPQWDTEKNMVISLNNASRGYTSVPKAVHDAEPDKYKHGRAPDTDTPRWPAELKPRVSDVVHDAAVLSYVAGRAGEPVLAFTSDMTSFFHQFMLSPREYPKACVLYDSLCEEHTHHTFAVEYAMAMGLTISSGVAQRGAHGLVHLWGKLMQEAEEQCEEQNPVLRQWLADRAQLDEGLEEDGSLWWNARLFSGMMYTDDFIGIVVGHDRCMRALRCWETVLLRTGFLRAPGKDQLGVALTVLGADVHFDAGIVVIPPEKVLKALTGLKQVIDHTITYADMKSLLGLLEHLLVLNCMERDAMYGMWAPMKAKYAGGPTDTVWISERIEDSAREWWRLLHVTAGCHFVEALPPTEDTHALIPRRLAPTQIHLYNDAALLGAPVPGIGGCFHGRHWDIPLMHLHPRMVELPIAWLEMVGAAINILMFHRHVWPSIMSAEDREVASNMQVVSHTDGLATPQVLATHSARSAGLQYIHKKLKRTEAFQALQDILVVIHTWGAGNSCSDCLSRGLKDEFHSLCAQLGITPVELQVPQDILRFLQEVYAFFRTLQEEAQSEDAPALEPAASTQCPEPDLQAPDSLGHVWDPTKGYEGEGPGSGSSCASASTDDLVPQAFRHDMHRVPVAGLSPEQFIVSIRNVTDGTVYRLACWPTNTLQRVLGCAHHKWGHKFYDLEMWSLRLSHGCHRQQRPTVGSPHVTQAMLAQDLSTEMFGCSPTCGCCCPRLFSIEAEQQNYRMRSSGSPRSTQDPPPRDDDYERARKMLKRSRAWSKKASPEYGVRGGIRLWAAKTKGSPRRNQKHEAEWHPTRGYDGEGPSPPPTWVRERKSTPSAKAVEAARMPMWSRIAQSMRVRATKQQRAKGAAGNSQLTQASRSQARQSRPTGQASQPRPAGQASTPTISTLRGRRPTVVKRKTTAVALQGRPPPNPLPSMVLADAQPLIERLQRDTSALALRPTSWKIVERWVAMEHKYKVRGRVNTTMVKDQGHWNKYWAPFCAVLRTPTLRNDPAAVTPGCVQHERERQLWAWFVLWVWDHIKPRSKRDTVARPASVTQVLLSVRREHRRNHLEHCLMPLKAVTEIIKGMVNWFRDTFGPEALLARRKEGMPAAVTEAILTLPDATRVGSRTVVNADFLWTSLKSMTAMLNNSGMRKNDVALTTGEQFGKQHFSYANFMYYVGAREVVEPSKADLLEMLATTETVIMGVTPPPSKADQSGERYGNFQINVRLRLDDTNAAYRMIMQEIAFPATNRDQRKATPAYGPTMGVAFTCAQLDKLLPDLLRAVADLKPTVLRHEHIPRYSWHSFRIGLACRLRNSKRSDGSRKYDDETIQALCRWATPLSIKVYGRLSRSHYAEILEEVGGMALDQAQTATLWQECPWIDDDHQYEFLHGLQMDLQPHE